MDNFFPQIHRSPHKKTTLKKELYLFPRRNSRLSVWFMIDEFPQMGYESEIATHFRQCIHSNISTPLHSIEIRGLRSMEYFSKMLKNLLYFMYIVFFHFVQLYFFPYECPGLMLTQIRAFIRGKFIISQNKEDYIWISYT